MTDASRMDKRYDSRDLDDRQRKLMESGGWCAPSACAVGICTNVSVHDDECPSPGWGYNEWEGVDMSLPWLLLPELKIKRGGIRHPWFRVETAISMHKRWLRRTFWRVNVRYHDGERMMHHYMTFYSASDAANAEQIIKFTVQAVNEKYWREKNAR